MEVPRECGEQCQFDCFCKLVLKHEAIDYLRKLKHHRDWETAFDALSQAELDKLCTMDHYPSNSYVFSAHGCDLRIGNDLVAVAFASLSPQDQNILILRCVLDMTDEEISPIVGLSRSAVQRHRTKALN